MSSATEYRISVPASTRYLGEIRRMVGDHARDFGFSSETISEIQLAVDEACTNVIKHAYKFDESKTLSIDVEKEGKGFTIIIKDKGIAFNSQKYQEPDIQKRIKNRQKGGVGVYLMKKLMDSVKYHSENGINTLSMTKLKSV